MPTPTPRKYFGPCDLHTERHRKCIHCQQWARRQRESKEQHNVPIYRGLHWPAPESLDG